MTRTRPARPDDAAAILTLIQALADYEREPDAVQVTEDVLRAQLSADRPPFECLLADADGEIVGFALFFHNYSTWRGKAGIYLEDLFVLPDRRGHGVGLALFRALAGIARERGCARLEFSVLDWNTPAQDFYTRIGARPLSDWTTWRLADDGIAVLADATRGA